MTQDLILIVAQFDLYSMVHWVCPLYFQFCLWICIQLGIVGHIVTEADRITVRCNTANDLVSFAGHYNVCFAQFFG